MADLIHTCVAVAGVSVEIQPVPYRRFPLVSPESRWKVGATHLPLPALLHAFLDAGLTLDRFTEGGTPTPIVLGVRALLS
jgi:hypothetical protein